MCILYILIPAALFSRVVYIFKQVDSDSTIKIYGATYDQLDTRKGPKVLVTKVMFLVRRVWLAFLIVFGR